MKNAPGFATLIVAICLSNLLIAQNFSSYYKDGLYKFDDGIKILKSEIFTTYKSNFGITTDNTMVLQSEGQMDNDGGVSSKYIQYYNGYKVEQTSMNVISKYGVVIYVNGFSFPYMNNVNTSDPFLSRML